MFCLEPRVRHFGVQMATTPCSQLLPAECTPLRSTSFHFVHLPGKERPVAPPQ